MTEPIRASRSHTSVRRIGIGAFARLVMAGGCSSGHRAVAKSPAATSTTSPRRLTTSAATAKQAAIDFAQEMLDAAILPPGARRSRKPPPPLLRFPFEEPAVTHVVKAHRLWVVPGEAHAIADFLLAHPPTGYVTSGGIGSAGGPEVRSLDVVDYPNVSPPHPAPALLEFGVLEEVSGHGHGTGRRGGRLDTAAAR